MASFSFILLPRRVRITALLFGLLATASGCGSQDETSSTTTASTQGGEGGQGGTSGHGGTGGTGGTGGQGGSAGHGGTGGTGGTGGQGGGQGGAGPAPCGNGTLDAGEDCDDGNTDSGDGCSATCAQEGVVMVTTADTFTCALLASGTVKCWGNNDVGELGLGDTLTRGNAPGQMGANLPAVDLGTGRTATAIASGITAVCALLDNESVKCWGHGAFGMLGQGNTMNLGDGPGEMGDALPTVNLGTGKTAKAIGSGAHHTCAILNDSTLKCWGRYDFGQLGLGDTAQRGDDPGEMGDALPAVDLGAGKLAVGISAGYYHTCALLNDGTVKCWGRNMNGQLGLGDTIDRADGPNEMGDNLPAVDLGTGKTVKALSVNSYGACAILNDDSLKCFGAHILGLGETGARGDEPNEMGDNLPAVDLGTGKTATRVAVGYSATCALLNDDSLKCWGLGALGALGLGDTQIRGNQPNQMGDNLPAVDLGTGKTATRLSTAYGHTCAALKDGGLKCWGYNDHGQLGQGDTQTRGDEPNEMGDNLPAILLQ
jgi:cysteine-rich repeat protein